MLFCVHTIRVHTDLQQSQKRDLIQIKVGIVQEHAANKILEDLASACNPFKMSVKLDYKIRGGLHTTVKVELGD